MTYGGEAEAERLRALLEPPNCPECRPEEAHFADCPVQYPPDPIGDALAYLDEALS